VPPGHNQDDASIIFYKMQQASEGAGQKACGKRKKNERSSGYF
jgi:hypothetical protein